MGKKKRKTGEVESLDFFWSFRSHYCYLALDRVCALPGEFRVAINLRPVMPLAIRDPSIFDRYAEDPRRGAYVRNDAERIAEMLGLKFGWPDPDPVDMNMQTFEVAAEQPRIHRLTMLAVAAGRRGRGLEFTSAVARLIYGGRKGWDQGNRLQRAVKSAGLTLSELDEAIENAPNSHLEEIRCNEEALAQAGHWGVPTLVFRDEAFFGQDRIDVCRWRLEQQGLAD